MNTFFTSVLFTCIKYNNVQTSTKYTCEINDTERSTREITHFGGLHLHSCQGSDESQSEKIY